MRLFMVLVVVRLAVWSGLYQLLIQPHYTAAWYRWGCRLSYGIAGLAAGLDVYENEPEVFNKLLELDNIVLTPHTGSATTYARYKMAEMVAEDVIAALKGKEPKNIVV